MFSPPSQLFLGKSQPDLYEGGISGWVALEAWEAFLDPRSVLI